MKCKPTATDAFPILSVPEQAMSKNIRQFLLDDATAARVAPRPTDREHVESLWHLYAPYAERDFVDRFADQTQQHFWEMYLTVALLRQGKNVVVQPSLKRGRRGPDVKVVEPNKVIWLEAIAVTHGTGASAVPRRELPTDGTVVVRNVPDTEMTLRYTAAIKAKLEKFSAYAGDPVAADDISVIALSAGDLDYRYTEMFLPRVLHALFPIGYYAVTIDKQTMKTVEEGHQYREQIGNVPTTFFATDQHAHISAVVFSYADICNPPEVLGNDFVVVHNPFARNPLTRGWLKLGREYWSEPGRLQPPTDWSETARHLM